MISVNLMFPTAVGIEYNALSETENAAVIDKCYEIKGRVQSNESAWLSGSQGPYNSFGNNNLIDEDDMEFLFTKLQEGIWQFSSAHQDAMDYKCSNSWFNIYSSGQFQEPHHHTYPSVYSAVYFPKAPEGSGAIIFQNPNLQTIPEDYLDGVNDLTYTYHKFVPKDNMMLFFKSSLSHYVVPGTNVEDRISVATNWVASGKLKNGVVVWES